LFPEAAKLVGAMRVAWIEARDFRNHREVTLTVPPGVTAAVGPNARGKTNLLEAVYYLCALESPRVSSDLPLVRRGAGSAYLRGEVESEGGRALVEVEVRAGGQNRVQVNRSPVRRKRDLRRHVRAVFCGPDDLSVVQGDPSERRRFMDESVKVLWPVKEGLAGAYERALRQRNRLLKDWPGPGLPPGLHAWDEELISHGSALTRARAEAVTRLRERAADEFAVLTGGREEVLEVAYEPSVSLLALSGPGRRDRPVAEQQALLDAPEDAQGDRGPDDGLERAFRRLLAERLEDELARRTTLVGPHRDDLGMRVRGMVARGFASHGETWGAALALRLALAGAVRDEVGETPVLMLDDPFSGLDPGRRDRLAASLEGRGQVLLAVPDDVHVPPGASVWRVDEGGVRAL
jgi:DNA replication and repair protein RecF